jgi:dTDP-4-dehydrorhamnose 3,5-epimerase
MKVLEIKSLAIPAVKVVRCGRFRDDRGYFMEHYRRSALKNNPFDRAFDKIEFVQGNESFSHAGVIRGLHFQWNPWMGKLVRTIAGHMVDLVLDIRKGSPTFGKIIAYDMPSEGALGEGGPPNPAAADCTEWIWVPPGFAHGNFFKQPSTIEYFCSGEYSPGCEAGISPLAADIDWSLCDASLKAAFEAVKPKAIMSPKDRDGLTVKAWKEDTRSENFIYGRC